MALSGSYDFSVTRDDIIVGALRVLGITKPGENPPTDVVTDCAEALNMMIKAWHTEGFGLWLNKLTTLFLQYETESFDIGPTGDNATESYNATTLSEDEETGDTEIEVTSATGITSTYYIGVELDDGTLQWTTVSGSPSGTTVTLAAALTDDAASGNTVYCYQTKTQRPLQILKVMLRDSDSHEIPVNIVSRDEYMSIVDKGNSGRPNMVYYDPQLTDGKLYVWPTTDTVDSVLRITTRSPVQDFDAATDDADFPIEWAEVLKFNLAVRLAPEYMDDIAEDRMKYIVKLADESKKNATRFDAEHGTSLYFVPEVR